jgi:hypothetical protein
MCVYGCLIEGEEESTGSKHDGFSIDNIPIPNNDDVRPNHGTQEKEARVVLCSHLGRPKGVTPSLRMAPVAARLTELLGQDVVYIEDSVGEMVEQRSVRGFRGEIGS